MDKKMEDFIKEHPDWIEKKKATWLDVKTGEHVKVGSNRTFVIDSVWDNIQFKQRLGLVGIYQNPETKEHAYVWKQVKTGNIWWTYQFEPNAYTIRLQNTKQTFLNIDRVTVVTQIEHKKWADEVQEIIQDQIEYDCE